MQIRLFNESLTMRFNTLERNIKSKTNSFYDSYLDLLEATITDQNNGASYDNIELEFYLYGNGWIQFYENYISLENLLHDK